MIGIFAVFIYLTDLTHFSLFNFSFKLSNISYCSNSSFSFIKTISKSDQIKHKFVALEPYNFTFKFGFNEFIVN